tara:strand:+ start:5809 stop:6819 length:1011 start_codon:yes stop_codon:yes gene_type:complete
MIIRKILFPVAILNFLVQIVRSFLYSTNFLTVYEAKINTICIGNLSMGGTGKTPLVKFLIDRLPKKINVSVLSRGYKRKTKGLVEVLVDSDVKDVGDENLMIKKSFKNVNVFACEDRLVAIQRISRNFNDDDILILDDAMQHRKIKCKLNILLTKFEDPFYNDFIFPLGNLREPRNGYKRANLIIITKCPTNLTSLQKDKIVKKINPLNHQRIFFSKIIYEDILKGKKNIHISDLDFDFILVTGIADSKPLIRHLKSKKLKFKHVRYNDHHNYNRNDIKKILNYSGNKKILTTKKDYYKIISIHDFNNLFYIDIKVDFFGKSNDLISLISNKLNFN